MLLHPQTFYLISYTNGHCSLCCITRWQVSLVAFNPIREAFCLHTPTYLSHMPAPSPDQSQA
jgi:hypothetical protein